MSFRDTQKPEPKPSLAIRPGWQAINGPRRPVESDVEAVENAEFEASDSPLTPTPSDLASRFPSLSPDSTNSTARIASYGFASSAERAPANGVHASHDWNSEWTVQAQRQGLLPASRTPSPQESPSPQSEMKSMAAMLMSLHERFTEKLEHVEANQRLLMAEIEEARAWKQNFGDRLQMQVDVVAELVQIVVGQDPREFARQREAAENTSRETRDEAVLTSAEHAAAKLSIETPEPMDRVVSDNPLREGKGSYAPPSPRSMSASHAPCRRVSPETAMSPTEYPTRTRSSGKRAPRPKHAHAAFARRQKGPSCQPQPQQQRKNTARPQQVAPKERETPARASASGRTASGSTTISTTAPPTRAPTTSTFTQQRQTIDPPTTLKSSKFMSTLPDGSKVPIFTFHKHPDTVREQWDEYSRGLHGQRPVQYLDDMYTTKWRSDTYARTWYSRRKRFWDLIRSLMKDGMGEEEAVREVEKLKGEMSVAGFIDHLAKESRKGKTFNRGGGGSNSNTKRKRGEPERDEDSDAASNKAPAERATQEPKRPRKSALGENEEKQLGVLSGSESEEKPTKRRTSLNLRGRQILGREDVLGEDSPEEESDSEASWHDHWR